MADTHALFAEVLILLGGAVLAAPIFKRLPEMRRQLADLERRLETLEGSKVAMPDVPEVS